MNKNRFSKCAKQVGNRPIRQHFAEIAISALFFAEALIDFAVTRCYFYAIKAEQRLLFSAETRKREEERRKKK